MGGDYVTLNQLVTAFNRTGSYSYKMISWVENRGLPVHNKRVQQNTFRVVYLKEFWTWAEKNRSFLDFSKLEPLAFGEEPAWVAEQRKRDFKACSLQRKDPWTPAEDAKLRMLLEQYKYTYEQMSDMLRRSPGAIQRRCADLGLKARPVRINPHGPEAVWHQEDYDRLAEGIKSGESYMSISKALGKSEKAIRGKVYYSQKTVALQMQRPSRDYIVITEASNVKGNLGQIEVSDQLSNGFKVAYTGSATAATINYIVIGGYMK